MSEKEKKLAEIFSDEEFTRALLSMETPEEVQTALKEKGLELTIDEIKEIAKAINASQEGELTEGNLEDVAGGSIWINPGLFPRIPLPLPWPRKPTVW